MQTVVASSASRIHALKKAIRAHSQHTIWHLFEGLVVGLIVTLIQGCAPVHIDHSLSTPTRSNTCVQAYQQAQQQMTNNNTNKQLQSWYNVAMYCPARTAQAIVKTAQITWQIWRQQYANDPQALANAADRRLNTVFANISSFAQANDHRRWSHDSLAGIARAEDKLAFIAQTIAAKRADATLLTASDQAASIASMLMSLAQRGEDLRESIYEIPFADLSKGIARDPASQQTVPLLAIATMDCAREELQAAGKSIVLMSQTTPKQDNDHGDKTDIVDNTASNHDADSFPLSKSSSGSSSSQNTEVTKQNITTTLRKNIVNLISARLLHAYALGYPTDESLILSK